MWVSVAVVRQDQLVVTSPEAFGSQHAQAGATEQTTLAAAMEAAPVALDGGLATLLEQRGHDLGTELWSARLLLDDPDAIRNAHSEYFTAGARVATTATYQASFAGLARVGLDTDAAGQVMALAVALADHARNDAIALDGVPRWVGVSVGPYGATKADGSEYHGQYGQPGHEFGSDPVAGLRAWHRPRLELLAEQVRAGRADLLAVETIPCTAEVLALLAELDQLQVPAWLSLSVAGTSTQAAEPLADLLVALAAAPDWLIAVGVNCSTPTDAAAACRVLAKTGRPIVVYPNSGERWVASNRSWSPASDSDGAAAECAEFATSARGTARAVSSLVNAGARLIGGCCRVGPTTVREVAHALSGPSAALS